jgi:hypothetical protein
MLGEIFGFFKQNQLIEAGVDKAAVAQQKEDVIVLHKAEEARAEAAVAAAAVPIADSLPDDGFRRD